jgi:hypothetical protein
VKPAETRWNRDERSDRPASVSELESVSSGPARQASQARAKAANPHNLAGLRWQGRSEDRQWPTVTHDDERLTRLGASDVITGPSSKVFDAQQPMEGR